MSSEDKQAFEKAAEKHWAQWIDNEAVEEIVGEDIAALWARLTAEEKEDCVMKLRWVLIDKAAALRTEDSPLPGEASASFVLPGYKDRANLEGQLRRDAPTGSRLAQHILFSWAASHSDWRLISADVRAAFLKRDPYMNRELYVVPPAAAPRVKVWKNSSIFKILKGQAMGKS